MAIQARSVKDSSLFFMFREERAEQHGGGTSFNGFSIIDQHRQSHSCHGQKTSVSKEQVISRLTVIYRGLAMKSLFIMSINMDLNMKGERAIQIQAVKRISQCSVSLNRLNSYNSYVLIKSYTCYCVYCSIVFHCMCITATENQTSQFLHYALH